MAYELFNDTVGISTFQRIAYFERGKVSLYGWSSARLNWIAQRKILLLCIRST